MVKYGKCIITGVNDPRLLIASHIKPWAQSNNSNRISIDNGLLLTPTFDKLFDYGLITFLPTGKLIASSLISKDTLNRLSVPINAIFDLKVTPNMKTNIEYHNDIIFAG